jgi:hypothetical protein
MLIHTNHICIGLFKMIVAKYGNCVRKFMWQLCGWGMVDICMTFHKRAFDFFLYHCRLIRQFSKLRDSDLSKKYQLCPTHTVATYIFVHILSHNHFESPNTVASKKNWSSKSCLDAMENGLL